jgi:hypothetical protein
VALSRCPDLWGSQVLPLLWETNEAVCHGSWGMKRRKRNKDKTETAFQPLGWPVTRVIRAGLVLLGNFLFAVLQMNWWLLVQGQHDNLAMRTGNLEIAVQ